MNLYETDFYAWLHEQALLVESGRFDALDVAHLVEELELMAGSTQGELYDRLIVLLAHLLKLQVAATLLPDVRQRPHTPLGGKLSRNIDLLEACLQEKRPRKPLLAGRGGISIRCQPVSFLSTFGWDLGRVASISTSIKRISRLASRRCACAIS